MKNTILILLSIVLLSTGCKAFKINVPANEVTFVTDHGRLTLKHPHNTAMTNVFVQIATNGTVTARIGALLTVNDPNVIDKTAAGEVAKINALGTQIREGVKAGLEATGSAAGAAVK